LKNAEDMVGNISPKKYGSSYEFAGSAEFKFLYWTGFTGLIGSIAFSVSGRNKKMAILLSAGEKSQRSRLYY